MNERKYWMTMNRTVWVIVLVISFIVFFPVFVALLVLWAVRKIKIEV